MILFPAIDLKNGQCVRLEQGDMARATVFSLDPAAQARAFAAQGFEYLHVVDLDGAFADCRKGLDSLDGMVEAMTEAVRQKARPFFGICVGMQLMATRGKEHITTEGLNWIAGDVEKITPREENFKIPHMGWNTLDMVREHPVLERLPLGPKGRHAYFVHSYHLNAVNEVDVLARADYGGPLTAIVGRDTMIGTQFHPEKSQRFGLALISNFLKWKP